MNKINYDNDKLYIANQIKKHHTQLCLKRFLNIAVKSCFIGIIFATILELIAIFVPIMYVHLICILVVSVSFITAIFLYILKPVSLKETALFIDSFGFNEEIITAYENINNSNPILDLQCKKTVYDLKSKNALIKYHIHPPIKNILLLTFITILFTILALIPSPPKKTANDMQQLTQTINQKEKELNKTIKEINELENNSLNKLSKEDLDTLKDLKETLNSALKEYDTVKDIDQFNSASNKLDFKINQSVKDISDALNNELLSNADSLENLLKNAKNNQFALAKNSADNTDDLNQNNNSNGQNNGQGQGQGQDQNNGQGQGQGQDQNNGQGQGQGQDQNNGQGQGQGQGKGTASNPHNYISIPKTDKSLQLTDNSKTGGNSIYEKNGLNWVGEHTSYDKVIGEYTNNAYAGISTGKYPSGSEELIKNYFSSLN